jgi:hypothetical protein
VDELRSGQIQGIHRQRPRRDGVNVVEPQDVSTELDSLILVPRQRPPSLIPSLLDVDPQVLVLRPDQHDYPSRVLTDARLTHLQPVGDEPSGVALLTKCYHAEPE